MCAMCSLRRNYSDRGDRADQTRRKETRRGWTDALLLLDFYAGFRECVLVGVRRGGSCSTEDVGVPCLRQPARSLARGTHDNTARADGDREAEFPAGLRVWTREGGDYGA